MFEFRNDLKNVKRNIKRYVLVGVLIFIISFISIIALIVNQSSQSTVEYYLNEYGSTATIDIDPEQMTMAFDPESNEGGSPIDIESLTYEDYEQIANSEYVNSVAYQQMTQVVNDDLITSDESEDGTTSDENAPSVDMMPGGGNQMIDSGSFSLIGSDDLESTSYFEDSENVLVDGEYPTEDSQVLISSNLADYNDLSVGDTIKFSTSDEETTVKLTISGLYQAASSEQMMMGVQNNIFTNYNTVSEFTDEKTNITATYTLTSYEVVEDFENELYANGLDEMYYVNNNQTLLEQIIGPVESTMNILNNVLIAVFIIGGAILIFINLLILRERKYEIGVLRALGMKTSKITKGLVTEAIIVAVIAMMAATVIGVTFAQPISDALIASNSITEQTGIGMEMQGGGSPGGQPSQSMPGAASSSDEAVTSIDVSVNMSALLITLAINLVLILLTTMVCSKFINRQHPNEILREQ